MSGNLGQPRRWPPARQNLTLSPTCSCRIGVKGIRLEIVPALAEPIVLAGLANTG